MITIRKARAKVQSLMVWVRQRPEFYARTVGELDSILWCQHMIWAMLVGREWEYNAALRAAGSKPKGLLNDSGRAAFVDRANKMTKRVLRFWGKVDRTLKVEPLCESWYDTELTTIGGTARRVARLSGRKP